ncbi:MAG: 3-dehydroquinate synthase II [Thermoplasmata archaeon]|nr:3-dehydroquinate synthase II [Thermoplasmata archaeon]MCI4359483.1 3-dehydroquinate synthase II [Thermoplasmata archaeon]
MTRERLILALVGRSRAGRAASLARARRLRFHDFAARPGQGFPPAPDERWYRYRDDRFSSTAGPRASVPFLTVRSPVQLSRALRVGAENGAVAIRWIGSRVIPLEGALSVRSPGSSIWVVTRRTEEVPAALGALEVGADRVVVEIPDPASVDALERTLEGARAGPLRWSTAVVSRVEPVGASERVLVDSTSLLAPNEGMLVGSSAGLLFHVASEAEGSEFSRPRPFRVNAGSPHLYILMADGTTRYLSELVTGDRPFVCRPGRPGRAVRVGRLKIERRPMLLIGARHGGTEATVFVQEAETVRLSGVSGREPVTELRRGHRLRVVALPAARHLGVVVNEQVEER